MKTALIACEQSGAVRSRLRVMGIEAWSCDILPAEDGSEFHIQGDAIEALKSRQWDMVIAFPPCTHLSVSGSRWFPEKRADGRQQEAIKFFMEFADCSVPLVAIENPVCIMSTEWRKPDQIIQPWQFGHGETKKTCLWLKGLPLLEHTNVVEGREQRVWKMGPGPERAKERSRTYAGIADAIASQWGRILGQ
tara:strand:+ start:7495 stop:8070 length:576 start_codon:yes stop_codon:yes gene_type:complete